MFIFVVQTLQKKWNEICMEQLAGGKHMENNCFPRTLKFEMSMNSQLNLYYQLGSRNIVLVFGSSMDIFLFCNFKLIKFMLISILS
jgi:hypothetical protein